MDRATHAAFSYWRQQSSARQKTLRGSRANPKLSPPVMKTYLFQPMTNENAAALHQVTELQICDLQRNQVMLRRGLSESRREQCSCRVRQSQQNIRNKTNGVQHRLFFLVSKSRHTGWQQRNVGGAQDARDIEKSAKIVFAVQDPSLLA